MKTHNKPDFSFGWWTDFDYLNVKSPMMAQKKRKDSIAPYQTPRDERFKAHVCLHTNTHMHAHKHTHACTHIVH